MMKVLGLLALLGVATAQSGCGIFFGNVKLEEKSDSYGIADMSQDNADWIRLDPGKIQNKDPDALPSEVGDVAYQSKKTAATISINSACRPGKENDRTLKAITDESLLGISSVTLREERNYIQQKDIPALDTTVLGKMNGEEVMLRTVILKRAACVYDLLYISPPSTFRAGEKDFEHFVASLRLK